MNPWHAFYPGDYLRDTAHLSLVEHGAYRLLLDHYYSTGVPLPSAKPALYRIVRAFEDSERAAVDAVLGQFFQLRKDGYHNERADKELAKRAEQQLKLSGSGRRGAETRWGKSTSPRVPDGQASSQANGHAMASPQPQPDPHPKPEAEKEGAPASGLPAAQPTPQASPFAFAGTHLKVTSRQDHLLGEAFPWVDRQAEYRKCDSWLESNPSRRPRNTGRFLHNWFSKIPSPSLDGKGVSRAEQRTRDNLKAAGFLQ